MRVLLTGADGKLASVVRPMLRAENFIVYNWGRQIELADRRAVKRAVSAISYNKIDAFVHLAGSYNAGTGAHAWEKNMQDNFRSFINVFDELLMQDVFADYPTIIAIGSPFDSDQIAQSQNPGYYKSKDFLRDSVSALNGRNMYSVCIEPSGAIDTDEKRDDIALRILDAIVVPLRLESWSNANEKS